MANLSIKKALAKVLNWIYNPSVIHDNGDANTEYLAKRSDTGTSVGFGIGTGGTNHGIWSYTLSKWIIHGDASNVYVDGIRMGSYSGQATKSGNYYSSGVISYYYKNGVVTLVLSGIATTSFSSRVTIATIPAGVRPSTEIFGNINNNTPAFLVETNGEIKLDAGMAGKTFWGSVTYVAWN